MSAGKSQGRNVVESTFWFEGQASWCATEFEVWAYLNTLSTKGELEEFNKLFNSSYFHSHSTLLAKRTAFQILLCHPVLTKIANIKCWTARYTLVDCFVILISMYNW